MARRTAVSKRTRRLVLMEAGYRCAIPTCRTPLTETAHIDSWKESHNNEARNLIALCPNCHTRYDHGEIPREALVAYKKKLLFLNDVYSRFEIDVLDHLKSNRRALIPCEILIKRLLEEAMVEVEQTIGYQSFDDGDEIPFLFSVTLRDKGKKLLADWAAVDDSLTRL